MATYTCTDGNASIEIIADTDREAAEDYVDGGTWGDSTATRWVIVHVTDPAGERTRHRITLDPPEPPCAADAHDWRTTDVIGHDGGVIVTEACAHCGRRMVTDTWATCPETGEQGFVSVSYERQVTGL